MSGQVISNLGRSAEPNSAVRKKYVKEKFLQKGAPIDMCQKSIRNVLPPVDDGDAANKSYVDSKSVGGNDLNMNGHLIENVRWAEKANDAVNRAYVYSVANTKLSLEGGVMTGDIHMNKHSIRYSNPNQMHEDEVVPKQ